MLCHYTKLYFNASLISIGNVCRRLCLRICVFTCVCIFLHGISSHLTILFFCVHLCTDSTGAADIISERYGPGADHVSVYVACQGTESSLVECILILLHSLICPTYNVGVICNISKDKKMFLPYLFCCPSFTLLQTSAYSAIRTLVNSETHMASCV